MNTSMILLIVPILIVIFVLYTFINRKGDFEKLANDKNILMGQKDIPKKRA